jgi:hypothetical protein
MDSATINAENISVSGLDGLHHGTITYHPRTRTALFTPEHPFEPGETVEVHISQHVSNLWGVPMHIGLGWTFQIEEVTVVGGSRSGDLPNSFVLHQNYPNPFNAETQIRFSLKRAGPVSLKIYTITGALIRTLVAGDLTGGEHRTAWNGADDQGRALASGVYFCRLETDGHSESKRMVLMR